MICITDLDQYLFGEGVHYEIYDKLGAHITKENEVEGTNFAVWAPHAEYISVVGDFNEWNVEANEMKKIGDIGIWSVCIPKNLSGALYKYYIIGADGKTHYKADPYAFSGELRPGNASRVASIEGYKWTDEKWVDHHKKNAGNSVAEPMSIYEVHIGSWRKDYKKNKDGFYDYKRAAKELAEYVKDMGYTHIELMGIAEYPFDGSWGYQVTGYYAPTSRYGEPKDFMYFVNYMHKNGIGVILDWVPAHFPRDAHGLAMFDGQPLYEYTDPKKGEHPDWGTKVFNYEMNEVSNFLIANALFWVEKYHVDGLRVDAVASMLYLDYGRDHGNWIPNKYGENKSLEAIEFLRHLNSVMKSRVPQAYLIAEESTAWPNVTKSPSDGGLGFTFKWNMGWMHDFLDYMRLDPLFKKGSHNRLTFGLTYAFSENFILALSHDEVVHLKCSMVNKMPGTLEDKLKNLKLAYTFMFGQPGKKLLFMGQDFAQLSEWSEEKSLEWHLLGEERHADIKSYVKDLLHLYKNHPVMYNDEAGYETFQWINCNDASRSIFSFIRKNSKGYDQAMVFIFNFTGMKRSNYSVGVPKKGSYRRLMSSVYNKDKVSFRAVKGECDGYPYRLDIPLKPFEAIVLKFPIVRKKS